MIFCHHLSIMSPSLRKPLKELPVLIYVKIKCSDSLALSILYFTVRFPHYSFLPSTARQKLFALLLPTLFSSFKISYCSHLKKHTHHFLLKQFTSFHPNLFLELPCNCLLLCAYTCFYKLKIYVHLYCSLLHR